jgi:hypothetical protein
MDPLNDFWIDYDALLHAAGDREGDDLISFVIEALKDCWIYDYGEMVQYKPYILDVHDRGFNFLFDLTLATHDKNDPDRPDDRVVAAYGLSRKAEAKRDASRIRGFGPIGNKSRGPIDKGHFAAHSMGGALDINIFPQRTEVNRGRSAAGKRYRKMEAYAAQHPGTFMFSRPIYDDATWTPDALDYGLLLLPERRIWAERFPN